MSSSRRGFQVVLATLGAVATSMGMLGVARGGAGVHQGGDISANVDSELRFFASWYAAFGVLVLRAARDPENNADVVRACGAGFLLAAFGRLLSRKSTGSPNRLFSVLTALEFAVPALIFPWNRQLQGRAAERPGPTAS